MAESPKMLTAYDAESRSITSLAAWQHPDGRIEAVVAHTRSFRLDPVAGREDGGSALQEHLTRLAPQAAERLAALVDEIRDAISRGETIPSPEGPEIGLVIPTAGMLEAKDHNTRRRDGNGALP